MEDSLGAPLHRHPYRPRARRALPGILVLSAISVFLAHDAMTRDRGVIIDHLIPLSATGASWLFGFFSLVLALGALSLAYQWLYLGLARGRTLTLFENGISLPASSWSLRMEPVAWAELDRAELRRYPRGKLRYLWAWRGDRRYVLLEDHLPSSEVFEDVCSRIAAALGAEEERS